MTHDGNLVSELGINKYIEAYKSIHFSNISMLGRTSTYEKKWQTCDFGCHGPTFRRAVPNTSYSTVLGGIQKESHFLAGVIDGIKTRAVDTPARIAGGIDRTTEGLGLQGQQRFQDVGGENLVVAQAFATTMKKAWEMDIQSIFNPIAQCVTAVVSAYISILPKEYINAIAETGALKVDSALNEGYIKAAAQLGIINLPDPSQLANASSLLKGRTGQFIGKQVGVKLTNAIIAIIVYQISLKILKSPQLTAHTKKNFSQLRKIAKGGLAGALVNLLKAQGHIDRAADSSRMLKRGCPALWNIMRYDLKGVDMILFLIHDYVVEYLDRLKLLETDPLMFASLMNALIKAGRTKEVFFPKKL
ncbi:cellulose-binding protein [Corallincola luteus]|uniref:Cellulose-binding protein n=1 Tax=Corallincola luteus TaxID=1775177 RepID=A0ABY2AJL0_9GAMM|nr:cellulose-binding protein [Corallincola luteus]TCI02398.1 cellulose-binding protein [Corallincola luteus]